MKGQFLLLGLMAAVAALADRPVAVCPAGRLAFERGEEGAELMLRVVGTGETFRRLEDGRVEVPLSYETNDGRLLMFLKRRIATVESKALWTGKPGGEIAITMTVRDETGEPVPARLPVEIHVYDTAGVELDGAGYACAEDGVCKLTVRTNLNDAPGEYRVVCRDRASGLVYDCRVNPSSR